MPRLISERIKEDLAIAPVAAGASGKTSSWYAMKGYGRARAVAGFSSTTATAAKLHFMQASDASGTGAKTVSSEIYTTDATTAETKKLALEIDVQDLDVNNDFTHLQVKVEYGTSDYVSAVLLRGDPAEAPPS